MDYQTLRYERTDHVVTLTYDRPEQHNAVNRQMNAELHDAWQRFRDEEESFRARDHGRRRASLLRRMGPSGCGRTDAARRLRRLSREPLRQPARVRLHAQDGHLQ